MPQRRRTNRQHKLRRTKMPKLARTTKRRARTNQPYVPDPILKNLLPYYDRMYGHMKL